MLEDILEIRKVNGIDVYFRKEDIQVKNKPAELEKIIKINPTKTCLYPMRDYVTCVEACTQPAIHNQLKGAH